MVTDARSVMPNLSPTVEKKKKKKKKKPTPSIKAFTSELFVLCPVKASSALVLSGYLMFWNSCLSCLSSIGSKLNSFSTCDSHINLHSSKTLAAN